ncbi:putative chemotaxis signal transduction protein CheW domain protein [Pseudomonas reidholzensis]|uniref:Putative chemotaxis signal transduction protein CheW domain protein n=1 Tax=Pseudomonas reidholzensis TaxID=1785162 RepID=A0A383RZN5_9PSED|nr:chemotaxis protein CheW [Pseudomonas reidholzensis]SYX92223.1 putative chemotaxis signal transduction protein CheW domain protein [Pseudomonas reidholzensis]
MTDLHPRETPAGHGNGALYLQFRLRQQRFALDVREVIEVLPRRVLKPIAQAPAWVAGILTHRGALIPVIDLSALSFATPAALRTSTRLVVVRYQPAAAGVELRLGLILEQATDTLRCHPDEFQPYGLDNAEAPYLGPVRQDAEGLLQRIQVNDLLPDEVRRLLFPEAPGQEPA